MTGGKTIICQDCGREFFWSGEEADFYRQKGLSEPKFCPICRAKAQAHRMNRMATGLNRIAGSNRMIRNRSKTLMYIDLTDKIIGLAYEIQNQYGSGQKESVYQNALAEKLARDKIPFQRELSINIKSEDSGKILGTHRLDFVADEKVIVEAKAVKFTPAKFEQQLYSYLRNSEYQVGLMINFGSPRVFVRRVIFTHPA